MAMSISVARNLSICCYREKPLTERCTYSFDSSYLMDLISVADVKREDLAINREIYYFEYF